jgi:alkanesulfonate monooxygenase
MTRSSLRLALRLPSVADRPALSHSFSPKLRDVRGDRFTSFDHVAHVARAAEVSGFSSVVIPWDADGDDALVAAAAIARRARGIGVVADVDAAFGTPVYAAKMAATFQRFSGNALGWRFVLDDAALSASGRALGDPLLGQDRVERADEFLTIARGIWTATPFSYAGRFFEVRDGGLLPPLSGRPFPEVHTAGAASSVVDLAARHADVHIWPARAPESIAAQVAQLDGVAEALDRRLVHAVELDVVARETEDEAWDEASSTALAGPGSLVGSYAQVASQLRSYREAGIDRFVVTARPALEEAYRLGAQLLPLLADDLVGTR